MRFLLSLPPSLVTRFHTLTGLPRTEYFCTSDPVGRRLGSGGGTVWLLEQCHRHEAPQADFPRWLSSKRRLLIHAGGQSRRLPAYAPIGKILTPIPISTEGNGPRTSPTLLDLQRPLYERIMEHAPASLHTMVVSGDVLIRAGQLQNLPEADVVCYGLPSEPTVATHHGVYVSRSETPDRLDFMLQKPPVEQLTQLSSTHRLLLDIGIWLLSDRAVERLRQKCHAPDGTLRYYDLYADFGRALGDHPSLPDPVLSDLSVAVRPLPEGEFYHYGTSADIIRSTAALLNHMGGSHCEKPQPSLFVQQSRVSRPFTAENHDIWVEHSVLGSGWQLTAEHVITGVPENDWQITLPRGVCIDIIALGERGYVLRSYGFHDAFRGSLTDSGTTFMERPAIQWLAERSLAPHDIEGFEDIQTARLFPIVATIDQLGQMLHYMIDSPGHEDLREVWMKAEKLAADSLLLAAPSPALSQKEGRK